MLVSFCMALLLRVFLSLSRAIESERSWAYSTLKNFSVDD